MKVKSLRNIIIGAVFLATVSGVLFAAKIEYLSDGGAVKTSDIAADDKYAARNEKQAPAPITILAFGDLLLDRYIRLYIDRHGADYPLENIKEVLAGNDIVLANLEGSFTDFSPRPLDPNNTSFTFDPALAPMLQSYGFNVLNLANNHTRDFGRAGFEQSQNYLAKNDIDYFGDYHNESGALIKEINGRKIAFVGYHSLDNPATEGTIEKIENVRGEADFVVVCAHWGAEYQNNFSKSQQDAGKKFIDAGADVVLGSHPHAIQPIEIYQNKPIFYSLGNFLFDQIFSFEVRHGLGVKITLGENKIEYELIPTAMKNFQVNLADDAAKQSILQTLSSKSIAADDILSQIAAGKFTLQ